MDGEVLSDFKRDSSSVPRSQIEIEIDQVPTLLTRGPWDRVLDNVNNTLCAYSSSMPTGLRSMSDFSGVRFDLTS